jgi:hypothetical protein
MMTEHDIPVCCQSGDSEGNAHTPPARDRLTVWSSSRRVRAIFRKALLLPKALAALVPSIAVAYVLYGLYLACVELLAHRAWRPRSSVRPTCSRISATFDRERLIADTR